ncbi:MAG: adenylate/guanylate cyclase domain-containing protein [Proteobacteria bacterium]|nr:adenylate/guanylate cyclase domain-containing protein [Pseudomonadota bacterium]NOG60440.1 adenylate/guanylate cyclase domain-containing protein [Pseudomonadota bacterium]
MLKISKISIIKISIIFFVFIIFLCGATGLIEITISQNPIFSINSKLFNASGNYNLALNTIILSNEFTLLLFSGLLLTVALPILSPLKAFLLTGVLLSLTVVIASYKTNVGLIPLEYCFLTILVIYIVNVLISYVIEIHSKQKLMESFGQYIPPHLVNELSRLPKELSLEGESRTLTVFFCDLLHFTSISEELNPKQLNRLLNEYFTVMTEILFKHEGTIDKYIGDAIMAFWNAPTEQIAHAQRSVEAALEMDLAIKELAKTFINRGWPGPMMGIGINTGRANVGNMGSKYRMTYTAIGDAVNLASRIESLTRTYNVPIIISEHTHRQLKGISCRELDTVQVRGKKHLTRIFQPLGYEEEVGGRLKEKLILHAEAIELYHDKKYKNASRLFKELYKLDRTDSYYKVMLKKIIDKQNNF